MRTHFVTTTAVAAALLAATSSARAQQTVWTGAAGGGNASWFADANWSNGVPNGRGANIDSTAPGGLGAVVATPPVATVGQLNVGAFNPGMLTIESGGTVSATGVAIGVVSQGTVTVSGAGSSLTAPGIAVGGAGGSVGTLTVSNGGVVTANNGTLVGGGTGPSGGTGTGTINIGAPAGAPPVAPGTLVTPSVTFGAGTGTINFNHTLTNYVFEPTISGSGSVRVLAGTTIFDNVKAYTGPTTISGGVLEVNAPGSIVSPTTVSGSGTLAGTGTVNAPVTINAGGTFSPGTPNVPTTSMTIGNSLTFMPGATYRVFLNPLNASFANVTGTASLAGTVNAVFASGSYVTKEYLILQSAGLGGTSFSGLTNTNLPAGFTASLRDTPTQVFLDLTASLGPSGLSGTFNVNQQNVANAINNFFNSGGTLPPGFVNVFNLNGANLANALTQLSGEVGTGAERSAFNLMTQFLNLMTDPYAVGFAPEQQQQQPGFVKAPPRTSYLKAPPAPPPLEQRWTAWGAGFGGVNHADGDAVIGSHNIRASDWGFAAGMDYHYSPDTLLGFALAGAGTDWDLAQGLGRGRSDAFMAGVHGATRYGPAYLTGAFGFANHWFTIDRTSFDSDQLRSTFNGQSYGGRLEGGYHYAVPFVVPLVGSAVNITPYAAVQSQWFHTPTYSETDLSGGGFGLTYDAMTANDTRSELGARFDSLTTFYGNRLILRSRIAWAHDWVDNPALNASFQALPGSAFTVFGAPIPHNSALTTTAAELDFAPNWSFTAKFDGEFASGSQTYAGTGTLRYTW